MTKFTKLSLAALALVGMSATAGTLEDTKKQGFVKCGVHVSNAGFSEVTSGGERKGMDVDGCRAVAAAVLGDASKVKYTPLNAKERFAALSSGEIDVLYRGTTWTETRDTSLGLNFAGVNYYDGQGFLVKNSDGIKNAAELNGATFCIQSGTTTELNVADYFRANKMTYKVNTYDSNAQVIASYESGRCDVITSDASQLYGIRSTLKKPAGHTVLAEIISKEPLGPVVRQGDDVWFNIIKWSYNAMVEAEELGVTSMNADKMKTSDSPAIKRLLGTEGNMGANLGLSADFAYNIVKQVGNYGEIFERNIGMNTPLKMKRGLNDLWTRGGLQYSPPFR